ncbi:MAG: hypothetical protein U9N36_11775 [Euryarchaeota archaeon]|nr:hypothetical protein [Euryarchaeota archaeon]
MNRVISCFTFIASGIGSPEAPYDQNHATQTLHHILLHDPEPPVIVGLDLNASKPPTIPNPDTVDNDHGRGFVDPVSLI